MMMMDVRELVTKFSFQVNSKAVTDFISLLAKAETSLDNLGGKMSTDKAIKNIAKKTNANKEAIKEETTTKLASIKAIEKAEKSTREKAEKAEKSTREKAEKAEKSTREKAIREEQRYQQWLQRGSQAKPLSSMYDGVYGARLKQNKATNKEIAKLKALEVNSNNGLPFRINHLQSKRLKEIQQSKAIRSRNIGFDRAFRPRHSFLPKKTEHTGLPNLFSKTEKTLSKELDALFKPMAKFQGKVADNKISVEKRTQREIANIQKRWDDRRRKRYTEEQRYQQWLQRGSQAKPLSSMYDGVYGARLKQNKATNKELNALRNPSMPKAPTGGGGGGGGGGFSLADTYFNVQLLKDAYQLFYNIAEATRQTAVNILRTNDQLSMSIAKIGVITGDTKNASKNFKELLDISAQTGSEIGVIEEIFNRLSMGKDGLGATTAQIVDFTSAIAKMSAFSEGGAAQQGALRQLGQMFGGAYIQAQEWNSIVDGLPMVATKIAKAMGTTREAMTFKIRQQTKDSPAYLISDIFPKLLKILPEIESEFSKLPPTLDKTLNKAGIGLLKFSLNLKESVKMPELDAFYIRLDETIGKVFEWAEANKVLIGTNIDIFFSNINKALEWFMLEISKPEDINIFTQALKETKEVLENINIALANAKPIADTLTSPAGILALNLMKQTLEALISPLTLISALVAVINSGFEAMGNYNVASAVQSLKDRKKLGATTEQLRREGYGNDVLGKAGLLGTPINYPSGMFGKNPQSGFGAKGGGVKVVQNNNFTGSSASKGEQKQTASLVGGSASHAVRKAVLAGGAKR